MLAWARQPSVATFLMAMVSINPLTEAKPGRISAWPRRSRSQKYAFILTIPTWYMLLLLATYMARTANGASIARRMVVSTGNRCFFVALKPEPLISLWTHTIRASSTLPFGKRNAFHTHLSAVAKGVVSSNRRMAAIVGRRSHAILAYRQDR